MAPLCPWYLRGRGGTRLGDYLEAGSKEEEQLLLYTELSLTLTILDLNC